LRESQGRRGGFPRTRGNEMEKKGETRKVSGPAIKRNLSGIGVGSVEDAWGTRKEEGGRTGYAEWKEGHLGGGILLCWALPRERTP